MQSSSIFLLKNILRTSLCKCSRTQKQQVVKSVRSLGVHRRCCSTAAALPLPNQDIDKQYSPKIQQIVQEISQLTLIEVADLNDLMKKTLKIADAPVMAMGMGNMQAQPKEEEEPEEAAPVKSSFNVKLLGFSADKKLALIKEIKNLVPGTNLVMAKKIVESTPINIKTDLIKDEAEALVKSLELVGAKVSME